MSTNKEYRKHEHGEDIMERLSDIIDFSDDCKENIRYLENLDEVKTKITSIKIFCNDILEWLK